MKRLLITEEDKRHILSLYNLNKMFLNETTEHTKNLYKSWAKKRSGNESAALSIMDDVFTHLNKLPKKDFAKYTSYEELKSDLDKVMAIQKEKSKSNDVDKLYEDEELLVVTPKNWETSCKYGAGSKWCTTSKDTSSHWERHNINGTEFFWIFKDKSSNDPNYKFSYHIKFNGSPDWCNAINRCSTDIPEDSYPKQHPKFDEIIEILQQYHNKRPNLTSIEEQNNYFLTNLLRNEYDLLSRKIFSLVDIEDIINNELENIRDMVEDAIRTYEDDGGEEELTVSDVLYEVKIGILDYLKETEFLDLIIRDLLYSFKKILSSKYGIQKDTLYNNLDFDFLNLLSQVPKRELNEIIFEQIGLITNDILNNHLELGEYISI